jgi:nucleoside-diphosphate-sugar epimerase
VVPPSTKLVILRISNVYGHPDLEDFVNQSWRSQAESRQQMVYQSGLIYRDFIHIDDLIKAICILLVRSHVDTDIFNISTGISLSAEEVLEIVRDLQDKSDIEIVSASKPFGILDRSILDSSKAIKALSWVPRNPKQGIVGYYRRLSSKSFE